MARLQEIRGLAEYTAKDVSSSPKDWMKYLDTAAKLYRYPFSDTLLIHAQRPDATACVSLEAWNQRMGRWVNRGAKGIALIDDTGPRRQLRYVFDVSDTHMVKGGRTPNLWQLQKEQEEAVLDHLADAYGLEGGDTESLSNALMAVASYMAEENLEEAMEGLQYEIEDSFLYGLDEDSIRVSDIVAFMKNPLFERMKRAKQAGVFHTEQPFVFIDLSEQSDKSKQDDTNQPDKNNGGQLIQGVIDVYFEEDGSLILVDYKTDKVSKKGGEDELRRRYALQLEYYAKALSQLLQKPVKEKIIYSFSLGKDIVLE